MKTTIKLLVILFMLSNNLAAQKKTILKFSLGVQYQLGYGNSTPSANLYSTKKNEKVTGKKMSKVSFNLSLSDYWIGNYQLKLYSSDSFVPQHTLSEEELEHQKTFSRIAFLIGKATGFVPAVSVSKYKYSLGYEIDDKEVIIFNEEGDELNIGDQFDLNSDIVKYSLVWGNDARYDTTTKDLFGSLELSYYQTKSKGSLEHSNSHYTTRMNILTDTFNAVGFTMTVGYVTKPINDFFQYRLGCHGEMAYGDLLIIKVGYFSSLLLGSSDSHFKGVFTLQGNLLESSDFGPSLIQDKIFNSLSVHQFSYDLLVGLSYSF